MARISDADKEAMKARLGEYLVRYCGVHDLNRNFTCPNPHHEDRNPSAQYNAGSNTVHCYGCGGTWDIFDLEGMREGIESFPDRVRSVAEKMGHRLSEDEQQPARPARQKGVPLPEPAGTAESILTGRDTFYFDLFEREGNGARVWLHSRGFDDEDIRRYGIGFILTPHALRPRLDFYTKESTARGYILLPFYSADFTAAHYATIRPVTATPEYKEYKPCGGVKQPLWREWLLTSHQDAVYVTEGILDAMAFEKLTGKHAVALCGKESGRLERVLAHAGDARPQKVIVALDNDAEGRDGTKKLEAMLDRLRIPHESVDTYGTYSDGTPIKDPNDLLMSLRGKTWDFERIPFGQGLEDWHTTVRLRANG